MRLLLVRHGDAYAGFHGPIAGSRSCRGLTPLGRDQAARLRDAMADDPLLQGAELVTSTVPRAIETAEIIAPALGTTTAQQDCDLCEVHPGDADGLDWEEHRVRWGSFDMAAEPDRHFAPNGDSWNSFHARVGGALERLAADHEGRTVVCVCHGGVISASMALLLCGATSTRARLTPTNTGVTEWDWDPAAAHWTLRGYNRIDHLRDA